MFCKKQIQVRAKEETSHINSNLYDLGVDVTKKAKQKVGIDELEVFGMFCQVGCRCKPINKFLIMFFINEDKLRNSWVDIKSVHSISEWKCFMKDFV